MHHRLGLISGKMNRLMHIPLNSKETALSFKIKFIAYWMFLQGVVSRRSWIFFTVLGALLAVETSFAQQKEGLKEAVEFSIPKTLYFTGEKIWIDAEVLLGQGPATSQVLYAELVDRASKSVAYVKMPLVGGKAFNYLELKSDIPSDQYLLRVYTRISAFLDRELGIAQQFVTLINPAIPPKVPSSSVTKSGFPQESNSFSKKESIGLPVPTEMEAADVMGFSIANPFLQDEQQSISSSQAYGFLREKELIPELFGHIVEIHAPNPKPDATYFLSLHGKKSALFTDIPDANGRILIDVGGMKHWDRMVIQLEDGAEMPGIEVVAPLIQTRFRSDFKFPELSLQESDLGSLEQLLKASLVEGYYKEEFLLDSMEVVVGFVADHTYNLDDYTRFEDVETVLREYVPSVIVRRQDKKKVFRLINEAVKGVFDSNPLILVDAMPVFDSDLLASFNPKFMERLEVLNREFYLNERSYSGVLSWASYENNFGLFPLAPSARFFDYYGLQPKIEMDLTQFSRANENGKFPDWRTVIFWGKDADSITQIQTPDLDGVFVFWTRFKDASGQVQTHRSYFKVLP
jgi:hypothetical protein